MQLDEFIAQSLIAVRKSVKNANDQLQDEHGNRPYTLGAIDKNKIEFDVAVTASEELGAKAGGGIQIAVVRLGADAETKTSQSSISRIKFSIYPQYNFLN